MRLTAWLKAIVRSATLGAAFLTVSAHASFTLNWVNNDTPSDETGFVIQRSDAGAAFQTIQTIADPTVTTYHDTDSTLDSAVTHAYRVYAYNAIANSAFSNVATNAPTFSVQPPSNQNFQVFGTATITATAIGIPAPTYQWQKNGIPLTDGGNVSGSTTATLTLSNLSAGDAATYAVIATNPFSPSATSNNGSLITINEASQTITFGAISPATFLGAPFALGATSSSGLTVSYASSNSNVATVIGNTVTIVGAGTTTIAASQAGDGNYLSATSVQQQLVVNQASQTIIFTGPFSETYGVAPFTLNAISTSGLPVAFDSSNTGIVAINGTTATVLAGGSSIITASQSGSANYLPAPNLAQTLTINPAAQTITFGVLPSLVIGGPSYTLVATASSGLPVTFFSSSSGVAATTGPFGATLVPEANGGTIQITAQQLGNNNYSAAPPVQQTLQVNQAPVFATQPLSTTVTAGGNANFSIVTSAIPSATTYQWQVSTDSGLVWANLSNVGVYIGVMGTNPNIVGATATLNGNEYRCIATNSVGPTTSNAVTLTVLFAPTVSTQPGAQTANAGNTATFTVSTTGNPAPTFQWSVLVAGGGTYAPLADVGGISGSSTDSLTVGGLTAAMSGNQYKVAITNSQGATTSNAATLTVNFAPAFSLQPSPQTANAGGTAIFTTAATGSPAPTFQWNVLVPGGSGYTPLTDGAGISGSTTASLTLSNVTAALNGNKYEAVATNSVNSATSTAALLTVNFAPTISGPPTGQTANTGNAATFTVSTTGNPTPAFQWSVLVAGGSTYAPLADGGGISGSATASLTVAGLTAAMNGNQYKVAVTNSQGTATSVPALLTVDFAPTISLQPNPQTANAGSTATFTIGATGNPASTYQWMVLVPGGGGYVPLTDGANVSGSASASLSLSGLAAAMNGNKYEAVATNGVSPVATSTAVLLTVNFAPSIGLQPGAQTSLAGGTAAFTVSATGNPAPTYQWRFSTNNGGSFANLSDGPGVSGSATANLNLSALTTAMSGYQYDAVATNGVGLAATSTPATLTVNLGLSFSAGPLSTTANAGGSATFTVSTAGNPAPTFRWQVSTDGGSTYTPLSDGPGVSGSGTASLTLTALAAGMTGSKYEAIATNTQGSVTSLPATLTVDFLPVISVQPSAQTATLGGGASFTVTAAGNPAPGFQWKVSTNGGASYNALVDGAGISGSGTSSLTLINLTLAMSGYRYEAVATNSAGSTTSTGVTLTVNPPAPTITSPLTASGVQGAAFQYLIVASPIATSFSASGLPAGLFVSTATGSISGVLTASPNNYPITIGAANSGGSASPQTLVLTVQGPAPVIASAVSANGQAGTAYTTGAPLYAVVATNNPTSYGATVGASGANLSTIGLSLNGAGQIIGTPSQAGTFSVVITAANATGAVSQTLTLIISPDAQAPVFAGLATPSGIQNSAFSFIPGFTGAVGYALVNQANADPSVLPTGLTISPVTGAITGTPTLVGTFGLAVQATATGGATTTQPITLTINPAPTAPVITSASVVTGQVGATYTSGSPLYTITATPASPAATFALGSLPAGITGLSVSGSTIVGSASAPGLYTVVLTPTNSVVAGPALSLSLTINPSPEAPVVTSSPVATGTVGIAFSYSATASNSPTGFVLTSGTLPAGLSLTGANIAGTPTTGGSSTVYLAGVNGRGQGQSLGLVLTFQPAAATPVIISNPTANAQVGVPFSYAIAATKSPTSYTASGLAGTGLSLNSSTGVISGIPASATAAPVGIVVTAVNSGGAGNPVTLNLTIAPAPATPTVTSGGTATGQVGTALQSATAFPTYQITASNSPTSYSAQGLPPGLSLSPVGGLITGTPTQAGVFTVTLQAGNLGGLGAASNLVYTVLAASAAPTITSAASATGTVGSNYPVSSPLYTITTNPAATAATSFALAGTLPQGLSLNTSTGAITGNPGEPGVTVVSLTATTAAGASLPEALAFTINPSPGAPVVTSSAEAIGTVGVSFNYAITATNATAGPPVVSLDAINLPPGLAVNPSTGLVSGTPSVAGTFTASLFGENASGLGSPAGLTLLISPPAASPAVTSATTAAAQAGLDFSYQITATNAPTSFQVSGAPGWMTVNNQNGVLGGTPAVPGMFAVQLTGTNSSGTGDSESLMISVSPAAGTPVVTSTLTYSGTVGTALAAYQISASVPASQPAASSFSAVGLPTGLALNSSTGVIAGTPIESGTYLVTLGASNSNGPGAPATLILTINSTFQLVP